MKTLSQEIYFNNDYDRYIKIVKEGNQITSISFMQGSDKTSFASVQTHNGCHHLLEIYKRLTAQKQHLHKKFANEKEVVEHAIELYVVAFILQEFI